MTSNAPQAKYRVDYRPPDYRISEVALDFHIGGGEVEVHACLQIARASTAQADASMRLHGRQMALQHIAIDGQALGEGDYQPDDNGLTLLAPPEAFELTTTVTIDPDANTALQGLYRSGEMLCTQCEAEGFSRITYFPDDLT